MTNIVEEITVKSASLPFDLQHEVLDFVDFITGKRPSVNSSQTGFQTVRGTLKRDLPNLEEDLTQIRHEMWGNFPDEALK